MRSMDDFLVYVLPFNYLRCNIGVQFPYIFFNKSHSSVLSQIICLKNIKQESHLFYYTLWIWYIHSIVLTEYTSYILWHAYQLAASQVKSQLKTIRKSGNWASSKFYSFL